MKISVVYEDSDIIIIDKPSGLITHQKNIEDKQPSVVDWVIANYPELKNIGEPFIASGAEVPRAGILHRLDKDTSGLLLIAKNNKTFFYLKNLFQTHKIKKRYLALVHGKPKEPKGTISSPLGRIGLKWTTKLNGPDAKSIEDPRFGNRASHGPNRDKKLIDQKKAETEYKTIKNYGEYTLLELSPKTGRTHQLRVHLNSIGHPITGDVIYGFKRLSPPPNLNRLFLHAYKLELITSEGKSLVVEADLPEDLQNVLNKLQ